MYKYIQICLVCYVCFIVFILIDLGKADESSNHRHRRYLSFRNMSHFFLRFNFKANMVPWSQIFAQALGFRMNWDAPPDTFHPYRNHYIHRRTIYNNVETLLDKNIFIHQINPHKFIITHEYSRKQIDCPRNGLNGFHCVRRAICEMETIADPRKIYHKLLKMVFRQQSSETNKWHNKTTEDCEVSVLSCPFSLLDVSLYTDIV